MLCRWIVSALTRRFSLCNCVAHHTFKRMKKDEIVSNQKKVPHLLLSEPTRRSLGRVGITALPFSSYFKSTSGRPGSGITSAIGADAPPHCECWQRAGAELRCSYVLIHN